MIPKVIHYCWFGRNPLPEDAKRCMASWRKYLPGYEIIEWNEDNFNVNAIPYTAQAYAAKKYAFVSDYARFKILYGNGGIYFDTDVELIKSLDGIIAAGSFMGIEKSLATTKGEGYIGVNAGLGLGAEKGLPIYKAFLDFYNNRNFIGETGTVVTIVTQLLMLQGLKNENEMQYVAGVKIYPAEYFCPMDSTTGIIKITPATVSIHHYTCSWIDHKSVKFRLYQFKKLLIKFFGEKSIMNIVAFLNFLKSKNLSLNK